VGLGQLAGRLLHAQREPFLPQFQHVGLQLVGGLAAQFLDRRHQQRQVANRRVVGSAVLQVLLVAVAVRNLRKFEQLANRAAGIKIVVHRGDEPRLARRRGV
jgi:hypothetical protein